MYTIFCEDAKGEKAQFEYDWSYPELLGAIKDLKREGYTDFEAVYIESNLDREFAE